MPQAPASSTHGATPAEAPRGDAVVQAALFMVFAQLFFGVMNVTARLGSLDVPWPEVGASRFFFGALVAFLLARSRKSSLRVVSRREMWMRTMWGTLAAMGTFYTLTSPRISLGDATTLLSTGPVFVALLSWPLLGERVNRGVVLAIALSLLGIVAVVKPTFHVAAREGAAALSMALFSSLAMISLRKLGTRESSEAVVFHYSLFAGFVFLALSIPGFKVPSLRGALYLATTGAVGGVAQLAMTRAYSLGRAARVSVIGYLGVVFTRLFAVPVFGEIPTWTQVAGSLLVIASGAVLSLSAARGFRARR